MYMIQARPKSGRKHADHHSLPFKSSSTPHRPHASHSLRAIILQSDAWGIFLMILALSMTIVASGCGGLTMNGTASQPATDKTKSSNSPSLSNVSCGTESLTGPQTKGCSVYLKSPATDGVVVSLYSDNPAITVPPTATVSAGTTSAGFNAVYSGVKTHDKVTVTASAGSDSTKTVIQLYPKSANLSSISCGTQKLTGSQKKSCSVYLDSTASDPIVVILASDNPAVTLPGSVTVSAGASTADFPIAAAPVTNTQSATLSASANGVSTTDSLQLVPESASTSDPGSTTQHEIAISWVAPDESNDPAAGYQIYRATGESTAFSLLDSTALQTTYADSTVQSGTTYGYQVRTVDKAGNVSSPSNTAYVTVP